MRVAQVARERAAALTRGREEDRRRRELERRRAAIEAQLAMLRGELEAIGEEAAGSAEEARSLDERRERDRAAMARSRKADEGTTTGGETHAERL